MKSGGCCGKRLPQRAQGEGLELYCRFSGGQTTLERLCEQKYEIQILRAFFQ
jgi:hypothetical protein